MPDTSLFDELSKPRASGSRLTKAASCSKNCSILQWVGGQSLSAMGQWLRTARRGLSVRPVWELDAGLGLSSGRGRTCSRRDYGGAPVRLPWGSAPMGASPGYHRAHTVASPDHPAGTQTCSRTATLVIHVTYRAALSSISEAVNNQIKTLTRQAYGYRYEALFILMISSAGAGKPSHRRTTAESR